MASINNPLMAAKFLLILAFIVANIGISGARSIGVCYGTKGNNLPSASDVVTLYKSNNVYHMRIYDPDGAVLDALRDSNIELILGIQNEDLQSLTDPANAAAWVQTNVVSFWPSVRFRYIVVGNEVGPVINSSAGYAQFLLTALINVFEAVRSAGLHDQIKVSISIDTSLLGDPNPPSSCAFRDDVRWFIDPIIRHLVWTNTPILATIYPFYAYSGRPKDFSLSYALFTSPSVVMWDTNTGLGYQNLFDEILDALYSALEEAGGGSLEVVVSETGWPSAGKFGASFYNAQTYISNLVRHVKRGTPKRPNRPIETYLFSMINENLKEPEWEKHFGLFFPDKQPKYQLSLGGKRSWNVSAKQNSTLALVSSM